MLAYIMPILYTSYRLRCRDADELGIFAMLIFSCLRDAIFHACQSLYAAATPPKMLRATLLDAARA